MEFLAGLTKASIEESRVHPGACVSNTLPANSSGKTLIRPGGRTCYPAVWTQDFALTLETGFVTPTEMHDHLVLIAAAQNGPEERRLRSGAIIPAFAIPDHVLFNGSPVYFPGTYDTGDEQGGARWGIVPPTCNHYDFILIAHHLWRATGATEFLRMSVGGLTIIERLKNAFQVPQVDSETSLIFTDHDRRAVGFIFCDSIYMTGHLLFASLLRWRAARHLADLEDALGNASAAETLRQIAATIPRNIQSKFSDPGHIGGWLRASTGTSNQPDVWGTIYALYLNILTPACAHAAIDEVIRALEDGTIAYQGALRHVPTNHDASPTSAWERTHTQFNHYQNGAYWHTPSGWLIAVLAKTNPCWANRIFGDMITHLKREDFRKGPDFCAPWECFGKDDRNRSNPLFLGSVAVPFGVLKSMARDTSCHE
ncbi:MAG: hypothetical protein WC205_01705 [Opitutaceae bacterium]|jgi:hypothetical protein